MPADDEIPDYYDILGINSDAGQDEIKKAYRSLAKAFHPDTSTHPNAQERFRKITEAYGILSDEKQREDYNSGYTAYRKEQNTRDEDEGDEFSKMADYEFYQDEAESYLIDGKKQTFENLRHIIIGDTEYIIVNDEMIKTGGIHRFTHKGEEKFLIDGEEIRISDAEHYYQDGSEYVIINNKPYKIKSP